MLEKLKKAKLFELQIWMWSAGIIGFGLGLLLSNLKKFAIVIILLGSIIHCWAMYKIYSRK